MLKMEFVCVNSIDLYYNQMGDVGISDQLQGNYCPDCWLSNQKWWWSIFIWSIGVGVVNSYNIYSKMYDWDKCKNKKG